MKSPVLKTWSNRIKFCVELTLISQFFEHWINKLTELTTLIQDN